MNNGVIDITLFISGSIESKGKKQPQRSSVGLNYGPITSSIDDKRKPRRSKHIQGKYYLIKTLSQRWVKDIS